VAKTIYAPEWGRTSVMKKLIVVMHGYDEDDCLTEGGRDGIMELAFDLQREVAGLGSVTIVSSPIKRAMESAKIISEVLGEPYEVHTALDHEAQFLPFLQSDLREYPVTFELVQVLELIYDVVILVTHAGSASCFPMYYKVHALGLQQESYRITGKGEAQILDCETGVIRVI